MGRTREGLWRFKNTSAKTVPARNRFRHCLANAGGAPTAPRHSSSYLRLSGRWVSTEPERAFISDGERLLGLCSPFEAIDPTFEPDFSFLAILSPCPLPPH